MAPRSRVLLLVLLAVLLVGVGGPPSARGDADPADRPVRIQLKWRHQFQFAGYYAALHEGYFAAAGLDVELVPGGPGVDVAAEVLGGRADYGVLASELVTLRGRGEPIVLLEIIFQHSNRALIVRADGPVFTPRDLVDRTIMLNRAEDAEFFAMFVHAGVDADAIRILPKDSTALQRLIDGEIVGMNGSIANQPYILARRGAEPRLIRPAEYGVEFFGDALFTTETEWQRNREVAQAVREAVRQGWRFAMEHPDAVIDLILADYATTKTRDQLRFEAAALRTVILPDLVDIGHISHDRVQRTFAAYHELGLVPAEPGLAGFFADDTGAGGLDRRQMLLLLGLAVVAVAALGILALFNRRLQREVEARTGALAAANVALQDEMAERTRAQAEIAESAQRYRTLVEGSGAIPFTIHVDERRYLYLGPQVVSVLGRSASHWQTCEDWFATVDEADRERVREIRAARMVAREDFDLEYRVRHADGTVRWLHEVVSFLTGREGPDEAVGFILDFTAVREAAARRAELEEIQREARKLESIGVLAGGIAHDLNNLLLPILGHIDLMEMDLPAGCDCSESLDVMRRAAERARDLVRDLLASGACQMLEFQDLDLGAVVSATASSLGRLLADDQRLIVKVPDRPLPVRADPGQVRDVLENLVHNAGDAMRGGGTLTIEADAPGSGPEAPLETVGPWVRIRVSDTGVGMAPADLARACEPFFTTKGRAYNAGMGLATVNGIVRQHGGHLELASRVGEGTQVTVWLPGTAPGKPGAGASSNLPSATPVPGRRPQDRPPEILLVEDDDSVRRFLSRTLEVLGFVVRDVAGGDQAMAAIRDDGDRFDVVLTDVVMPRMSGWAVYEQTAESHPDLPFLFMSGYGDDVLPSDRAGGRVHFLAKPFTRDALEAKLAEVLGEG